MRILVNGSEREIGAGVSLLVVLETLGVDPRRVAVAVNAAVVPRGEWAARHLAEGDRLEIIEAVGGG